MEQENKLKEYLELLRSEFFGKDHLMTSVIDYAWCIWQELKKAFFGENQLEVPDACPGERRFMYTWRRGEHYLECEILWDGAVEFFYRNKKNGETWAEDTTILGKPSVSILQKVAIFA